MSKIQNKKIDTVLTTSSAEPKKGLPLDPLRFFAKPSPPEEKAPILVKHLPFVPKGHPLEKQSSLTFVGHEADFLIRNTYLEGSVTETNAERLKIFITLCKEENLLSSETLDKIEKFLDNCHFEANINSTKEELTAIAQEVAEKLHKLPLGESLTLEGGWVKKESTGNFGGHAVLYTFKKVSTNLYDIYIYNTGEGIQDFHHQKLVSDGMKQHSLYCPYVKFQEVNGERIGLTSEKAYSGFFEKLFRLKNARISSDISSPARLYTTREGFGALQDRLVKADSNTPFMRPQRSGTCALSVFFAALHSLFASEEEYKVFKFLLGYTDLCLLFDKQTNLAKDKEAQHLILEQARKLQRSLEKRSHLFSSEALVAAQNKLNSIITYIEQIKEDPLNLVTNPLNDSPKALRNISFSYYSTWENYYNYYYYLPEKNMEWLLKPPTQDTLLDYLSEIQEIKDYDESISIYATEQLTPLLLSLKKEDLEKLCPDDAIALLKNLHSVQHNYLKSCNILYLETNQTCRNTAWALAAIAHEVSSVLIPDLKKFELFHDPLITDRKKELYAEISPTESQRLQTIINRLQGSSKKPAIFNFISYLELKKSSPLPPEFSILQEAAGLQHKHLSFKEQLSLLIETEHLNDSLKGKTLIYLRDIAYLASLTSPSNFFKEGLSVANIQNSFCVKTFNYSDFWIAHYRNLVSSTEKAWFKLRNLIPPQNLYNPLRNNPSTVQPENNTLSLAQDYFYSKEIPPATASNALLRASKLLYFASLHQLELKKSAAQRSFFSFLFSSTPEENGDPVIYAAIQDKAFLEQLQDFIDQGLQSFSFNWIQKKPDILSSLFFLRLQRRVEELSPTVSLKPKNSLINEWLKRDDLLEEEKMLLHLHRVLQYKKTAPKDLSNEALEEIFVSWFSCKDYFFIETADGRFQKEEAFRFFLSLMPALERLDLNQVLSKILHKSIDELRLENSWSPLSYFVFRNGDWTLDLLKGQIVKNDHILSLGINTDIRNIPSYEKIFQKMNPSIFKEEDGYLFKDEKTGISYRYVDCALQVLFEGNWYEYKKYETSNACAILYTDYHCFANGCSRLYIDKKTRKVVFATNATGELINCQTKAITLGIHRHPILNLFERDEYRLHEINESGFKTIRFPRFISTAGAELCFVENDKGQFTLKGYPDYVLVEPIQGIIGSLENILCCKHAQSGEIKIFVPILPKNPKQRNVGPITSLDLFLEVEKEQSKTRTYAEYTYANETLSCKDREAKTFLIYLYLLQRKEKEALEILESLGRERIPSDKMVEILERVINFCDTPKSIPVALQAALYLERTKGSYKKIRINLLQKYRDTYTNIPAPLRLKERELKEIGCDFQSPYFEQIFSATYPKTIKNSHKSGRSDFIILYRQLAEVTSSKERQRILATTPINIADFSDHEFRRIIARVEHLSGNIPHLPEDLSTENLSIWSYNTLKSFGDPFPSEYLNSTTPDIGSVKNKDIPLPKKHPLSSLQSSLNKALTPNYKENAFPTSSLQNYNLEALFNKHFQTPSLKPSAPLPPLVLSQPIAASHQIPVTHNLEKINTGLQKVEKSTFATLQEHSSTQKIKRELKEALQTLDSSLQKDQENLLILSNTGPSDPVQAKQLSRLQSGKFTQTITWDNLINSYLKGNYNELNPHLTEKQWEELDTRVRAHLVQSTMLDQIKRALKDSDPQKIGSTLQEKIAYSPSTDKETRVFLVYEYRSHNRIRKEQIKAIQTLLSNKNIVLQMIMGGGKTTVLTSILLELLPKGTIPFFIPLPAQFETQVANLSKLQYDYYRKQVIPMRFGREDLTLTKLYWIQEKLQDSLNYQEPIITTASSLECLQLEWLSLLDTPDISITSEEAKKKEVLTLILRTLKANGMAILDEVDQILDLFTEHNFPIGSKEKIDILYVDFIADIFKIHLDPSIQIAQSLIAGEQSSYSKNEYEQKILPIVAEKLFSLYQEKLLLKETDKESFLDYILYGKETPDFRALLETRINGKNSLEKESAELICLSKGLFSQILPIVMSRTENKNYGIPKGSEDRKVIPFLGVDSPASTEFAGPYETACYHYLTALSSPITKKQIHHITTLYMKAVAPLLQYSTVELQKTPEYIQFFSLTGAALDKVYLENTEELEKAHQYLLAHPEKRLDLEKVFIRKHVGMYTEYYQSNPQSLFHLFANAKGLTGTPWNSLTYPESLKNNVHKDTTVEASIRATFLTRADLQTSKVYFTPSSDVKQTLSFALENNPRKDKFRSLLDPIGFFKDLSNEQVAKEILSYFENDPSIDSVLFFGRKKGNMGIPGTPMILKKQRNIDGNFSMEILEGTSKEMLEAQGVNLSKTITYYDERHCEATDLPQMIESLGLVIVGASLKDRDLLQTQLRLRDYMNSQDVDLIVPEKEKTNYPSNPTGRDILLQAEITQETQIADEAFISLCQKIHSVFREKAIQDLLLIPTHTRAKRLRSAFVSCQSMSPYALFGKISQQTDPLTAFNIKLETEKKKQIHLNNDYTKKELENLKNQLRKNLSLYPSLVPVSESVHGMEMEMAIEHEVELENELELEYEFYQSEYSYPPFKEKDYPRIFSPSSLLQMTTYKKPYHKLFINSAFTVTENFAYTETRLLSIFSKKQKPADQILITQDSFGLHATLVSAQEGASYKKKILAGAKNMWLYLPDGHLHVESATKLENSEALSNILFEINFFNGNSQYLLQHKEQMISKITKDPENKDLLFHFLGLKAEQDPVEKGALARLQVELSQIGTTSSKTLSAKESISYLNLLWEKILHLLEALLNYLKEIYYRIDNFRHPPTWEIPANKV